MIVVSLKGGLGNQMFQYAFGRAAAEAHGRRLCLDLSMLPTGKPPYLRTYGLDSLPIAAQTLIVGRRGLDAEEIRERPSMRRVGKKLRRRLSSWLVREPDEESLLRLDAVPRPIAVFVGYWQSHHYFSAIGDQIRRELAPPVPEGGRVAGLLDATNGRISIAVHVRRGDYVSNQSIRETHGYQGSDYYERAVARIAARCEDEPTVVVLSDEPRWAKENLGFRVPSVHAELEEPLSATDALSLLSRCDHHVISNSSFSWWGAWLAEKPRQEVIYPRRWFMDREVDPAFRFPEHWTPQD